MRKEVKLVKLAKPLVGGRGLPREVPKD